MIDFPITNHLPWENPPGWNDRQNTKTVGETTIFRVKRRVIDNGLCYLAIEWKEYNEPDHTDPDVRVYEVVPIKVTDYVRRT